MRKDSFKYSFTSPKNIHEVFTHVSDPKNWWVGLFGETIEGKSARINDEFSFKAGDGAHYSHQKLTELVSDKKIAWLVTQSNLSFLKNTNEWAGTKIGFELEKEGERTDVTFIHDGLIPHIECYGGCSGAWTQYLQNLKEHLQ